MASETGKKRHQSNRSNSSDDDDEEEDWEGVFNELCAYKKQLGHANPKRSSVPRLGEWAHQMRKLYAQNANGKKTSLTEVRIAKLESIGFRFFDKEEKKPPSETATRGKAASLNKKKNKYAVGTAVSKNFYVGDTDEIRPFSGEVTQYDVNTKLYSVKYHEDKYEEQMEEGALSKIILLGGKNSEKQKNGISRTQDPSDESEQSSDSEESSDSEGGVSSSSEGEASSTRPPKKRKADEVKVKSGEARSEARMSRVRVVKRTSAFQIGDRVEARYRGRGEQYYHGVIVGVNSKKGTYSYDVDYDDSDKDRGLSGEFIQKLTGKLKLADVSVMSDEGGEGRCRSSNSWGGNTCSREGCTRFALRGGVCIRHGRRLSSGGNTCSRVGCTKKAENRGLCQKHWAYKKAAGSDEKGAEATVAGGRKRTAGKGDEDLPNSKKSRRVAADAGADSLKSPPEEIVKLNNDPVAAAALDALSSSDDEAPSTTVVAASKEPAKDAKSFPSSVPNGEPKYVVGTAVTKLFYDADEDEELPFYGEVKRYDANTKLYWIKYEDGDDEDLEEGELSKLVEGDDGKPKYAVGTAVSKVFYDEVKGKERPFSGEVTGCDTETKMYTILYEDGDDEEMDEKNLSEIVVGDDDKPKYAVGTAVSKVFYVEDEGRRRPFRGEVIKYAADTKMYTILFEDGDDEEMGEGRLSKIVVHVGKYNLGKQKQSEREVTVTDSNYTTTLPSKQTKVVKQSSGSTKPDFHMKPKALSGGYLNGAKTLRQTLCPKTCDKSLHDKRGQSCANQQPKYAVGTIVSKLFYDEDQDDKIRRFSGDVTRYDARTKLYSVKYHEDEYEEEMKEEALSKIVPSLKKEIEVGDSDKPKYAIGTAVSTVFCVKDNDQERCFHGKVTGYNARDKLYSITYEDGDEEEIDERELSKIVVNGKRERNQPKYAVGTTVSTSFYVEDEDKERAFLGEVTGYDADTKLYSIKYDDSDEEEIDEGALSKIVINYADVADEEFSDDNDSTTTDDSNSDSEMSVQSESSASNPKTAAPRPGAKTHSTNEIADEGLGEDAKGSGETDNSLPVEDKTLSSDNEDKGGDSHGDIEFGTEETKGYVPDAPEASEPEHSDENKAASVASRMREVGFEEQPGLETTTTAGRTTALADDEEAKSQIDEAYIAATIAAEPPPFINESCPPDTAEKQPCVDEARQHSHTHGSEEEEEGYLLAGEAIESWPSPKHEGMEGTVVPPIVSNTEKEQSGVEKIDSAELSELTLTSPEKNTASGNEQEGDQIMRTITVVGTKLSKDSKLGIVISQKKGTSTQQTATAPIRVTKIESNSSQLEKKRHRKEVSDLIALGPRICSRDGCNNPTQMGDVCMRHHESVAHLWEKASKPQEVKTVAAKTAAKKQMNEKPEKLGIAIGQKNDQTTAPIRVTKIEPNSPFAGTELRKGMKIESINGKIFTTTAQYVDFLKTVVGEVVIVSSVVAPPVITSNEYNPLAPKPVPTSVEEEQDAVMILASGEGKEQMALNNKLTNSKGHANKLTPTACNLQEEGTQLHQKKKQKTGGQFSTHEEPAKLVDEDVLPPTITATTGKEASTTTATGAGAVGTLKSPPEKKITATVTKPSKDSKLGLDIASNNKEGAVVTRIAHDGLFAGTDLAIGMRIETINGSRFSKYEQQIDYLKSVVGQVVIEASYIARILPANAEGLANAKHESESSGMVTKDVLTSSATVAKKQSKGGSNPWQCHNCGQENPNSMGRCSCLAWPGGKHPKADATRKKDGLKKPRGLSTKSLSMGKALREEQKPKYAVGTAVSKLFYDEDEDKERAFSGKVTGYDTSTKLYWILYEDGDDEEIDERELSKIVMNVKRERNQPKYAVGTTVSTSFYVEDEDKERAFLGEVTGYNAKTKLYSIKYDDSDEEEIDEGELSKIILDGGKTSGKQKSVIDKGAEVSPKHAIGTIVSNMFYIKDEGRERAFSGEVTGYDANTKMYWVKYFEDEYVEQIEEGRLSKIVIDGTQNRKQSADAKTRRSSYVGVSLHRNSKKYISQAYVPQKKKASRHCASSATETQPVNAEAVLAHRRDILSWVRECRIAAEKRIDEGNVEDDSLLFMRDEEDVDADGLPNHRLLLLAKASAAARTSDRTEFWFPEIDVESGTVVCKKGNDYPTYMLEEQNDYLFSSREKCLEKWGKKVPTDAQESTKATTTSTSDVTDQKQRLPLRKRHGKINQYSFDTATVAAVNNPPSTSILPEFGRVSKLGANIDPMAIQILNKDAQTTSQLASQLQNLTGGGHLSQVNSRPVAAAPPPILGNLFSRLGAELPQAATIAAIPNLPQTNLARGVSHDMALLSELFPVAQHARKEVPASHLHPRMGRPADTAAPLALRSLISLSNEEIVTMLGQLKQPQQPSASDPYNRNITSLSDVQLRQMLQTQQPSVSNPQNNICLMSNEVIAGMLHQLKPQQGSSASASNPSKHSSLGNEQIRKRQRGGNGALQPPAYNINQQQRPSASNPRNILQMSNGQIEEMICKLRPPQQHYPPTHNQQQRPSASPASNSNTESTVDKQIRERLIRLKQERLSHQNSVSSTSDSGQMPHQMSDEQINEMIHKLQTQPCLPTFNHNQQYSSASNSNTDRSILRQQRSDIGGASKGDGEKGCEGKKEDKSDKSDK